MLETDILCKNLKDGGALGRKSLSPRIGRERSQEGVGRPLRSVALTGASSRCSSMHEISVSPGFLKKI